MAQIIVKKKSSIRDFPFADEVHDMGDFIKDNTQILGSDSVIVCRELQVGTSDESRGIDFLAYDTELNQVVIVELKKGIADEKVLLQTLRYADWIRNNPDTVRYQIRKNELEINEDEIDPDRVKILIVAPKISRALAELCQYITAFDFEFVQLQRFRDDNGEVYAFADNVEIESRVTPPSRARGEYDIDWYESQGVRPEQFGELKEAIKRFQNVCQEKDLDLGVRYVKWSVRFQTPGGRNAFYLAVRKTQNHVLRLCLGPDFDPGSIDLRPEIGKKLKHTKESSRWWRIVLEVGEIDEYTPLLQAAYENISG